MKKEKSQLLTTSEAGVSFQRYDKGAALHGLMKDLDRAKARADREGWIDTDEAERILEGDEMIIVETNKAYRFSRACDNRFSKDRKAEYEIDEGVTAVFAKQNSGKYVLCSMLFSKKLFDRKDAQLYWDTYDVRLLTKKNDWNRKIPPAEFVIPVNGDLMVVACYKNAPKYRTLREQYSEMTLFPDDEDFCEDDDNVAKHPDIKDYNEANQYIRTLMEIYNHTDDSLIEGLGILNATTLAQEGACPDDFLHHFGADIKEFYDFFWTTFVTDYFEEKMLGNWGDLPRILRIGFQLKMQETVDITDQMVEEAREHLSDVQKRNAEKLAEYFLRDSEHVRYLTTIYGQRVFHHQFGPGRGINEKNEIAWLAANLIHHGKNGCFFRTVLADDCHIINGFLFEDGKPVCIPAGELRLIMEQQPDGSLVRNHIERYQQAFISFD